jgi:hypothetical protein
VACALAALGVVEPTGGVANKHGAPHGAELYPGIGKGSNDVHPVAMRWGLIVGLQVVHLDIADVGVRVRVRLEQGASTARPSAAPADLSPSHSIIRRPWSDSANWLPP